MKRLFVVVVVVLVSVFGLGSASVFAANYTVEINNADGVYHPGENLEITLFSDTPCYFQIEYTDADKNTSVLYPSLPTDDTKLNAKVKRTLFSGQEESLILEEPFGTENITVTFSKKPIKNGKVVKRNVLETKSLSYNIEPFKVIMEFKSPQDVVKALKDEAAAQGRKVSGDAQKGSFDTPIMTISYEISGTELALIMPKSPDLFSMPLTRGKAQSPVKVALNIPPTEIPSRFDKAKQTISSKKGGKFIGDTSKGNFETLEPLGGASGSYEVIGGNVGITVSKYPGIAPESLVKSTVEGFFK